jgi:beta-lactamase regulating signal transducer with metallopeptidase domain
MVESTKNKSETSINKQSLALWSLVMLVLLIPLVVMQFTDEVNWDGMDFLVAAALLTFSALGYQLAAKKLSNVKTRMAVGIVIVAILLIVWIELAVGLF